KSRQEMLLGGLNLWPREWTLDNFERAWTVGRFGEFTGNTLTFSIAAVTIQVVTAALAGYALSARDLPGRKTVMGILVTAMLSRMVTQSSLCLNSSIHSACRMVYWVPRSHRRLPD